MWPVAPAGPAEGWPTPLHSETPRLGILQIRLAVSQAKKSGPNVPSFSSISWQGLIFESFLCNRH